MRQNIKAFTVFAAYTVIFLLTEYALYGRFAAIFGSDSVAPLYSILMFLTGCGYLLYPLLSRFISETATRRAAPAAAIIFCAASLCTAIFRQYAAAVFSAFISMLAGGYLGGTVLHTGAVLLRENRAVGRIFAAATAVATLIQYSIQNYAAAPAAHIAAVTLGTALLLWALPLPPTEFKPAAHGGEKTGRYSRALVSAAVIDPAAIASISEKTSGGSSSGCSAGFGALALLALMPIAFRRKK